METTLSPSPTPAAGSLVFEKVLILFGMLVTTMVCGLVPKSLVRSTHTSSR